MGALMVDAGWNGGFDGKCCPGVFEKPKALPVGLNRSA